jgi:UDP-N-acetylmuramate--alanine ligase
VTVELSLHRHVHFVGICGIGMSALASFLLARGYRVSGSDRSPDAQGEALTLAGADVVAGHAAENTAGADLIVVSSAVPPDNSEIRAAIEAGIPVIKRAELLAAVMNPARGIAVAGTHGKTTTSALIGHIFTWAGLDPSILIGGIASDLGSNARRGESALVVVEADEYDASFLQLRPEVAVVTNVEPDHLDFYGTVDRLHDAFRRFSEAVKDTLVICADDPVLPGLTTDVAARRIGYGLVDGEWRGADVREAEGWTKFSVYHEGRMVPYAISLAGEHNVRNCLAAIVVARELGIGHEVIVPAVASFSGVGRRFERVGEVNGVVLLDDYAHHPTEIRVNLAAARKRFGRPPRVVFQPHTYSRTRALLDDFAVAFGDASAVYLMEIYPARESDTLGVSGQQLAEAIAREHRHAVFTPTAEEAVDRVVRDAEPGDVVMTMGAGDVYRIGPEILGRLRTR